MNLFAILRTEKKKMRKISEDKSMLTQRREKEGPHCNISQNTLICLHQLRLNVLYML